VGFFCRETAMAFNPCINYEARTYGRLLTHAFRKAGVELGIAASRVVSLHRTPQLTLIALLGALRRNDVAAFKECFTAGTRRDISARATREGVDVNAVWAKFMKSFTAINEKCDGILSLVSWRRSECVCRLGHRYFMATFQRESDGSYRLLA
jgi:hypothetical protein